MASEEVFTGTPVPLSMGGIQIVIADSLALFFATLFFGLRFYARRMRGVSVQAEDYIVLVALFAFYCTVTLSLLGVVYGGFGHHITQLQPFHTHTIRKLALGSQVLYAVCLCLVKCSICVMLQRIFFVTTFRYVAIGTMTLCVVWAVVTILMALLICQPIRMYWDRTTPGGTCGNEVLPFIVVGVGDLVTDLIIMALPIPMIFSLHLATANKIGLCLIFGTGILTMLAGGLRMGTVFCLDFSDFPYTSREANIWGITEQCVAIMVASSPILRPIFDKIFCTILSRSQRSNSQPRLYYKEESQSKSKSKSGRSINSICQAVISPKSLKQNKKTTNTFGDEEGMDDEVALNVFTGENAATVKTTVSPGPCPGYGMGSNNNNNNNNTLSESPETEVQKSQQIVVQTTLTQDYYDS